MELVGEFNVPQSTLAPLFCMPGMPQFTNETNSFMVCNNVIHQ